MAIGNYWCVDCDCGKSNNARKFTHPLEDADDEPDVYCPNNPDLKLKKMGVKAFTIATHTRTRGAGRTAKEKAQRRKTSFHEQVSTQMQLDPVEKRHFGKKFGKPQ